MAKKAIIKNIPNSITFIRLFAAVFMIFLEPLSMEFFVVYGVCGLTDALDGFLARKLNATSQLGNILDSVSDLLFYAVMGYKIFPAMTKMLDIGHWLMILIPTGFHVLAYITCAIKFKRFSALHTYANKALSVIIFVFPFTLIGDIYLLYTLYIYINGVIALYGSIEMFLIHIVARRYDVRNKSIFFIKRNEAKELAQQ